MMLAKKVLIMKKILLVQFVLLGLVIFDGAYLKSHLSADVVRLLHRALGLLAVIVGIVAIVAAFKYKLGKLVKSLLVVALLTTMLAGASGRSAAAGKGDYTKSFNVMRTLAVVALASSVGSYFIVNKPVSKKPDTTTSQD